MLPYRNPLASASCAGMPHKRRMPKLQKGVALIEAIIALLVLAFGIFGLVGVQSRMLVESRTSNSRAAAIRLISDLNERIQLNLGGMRISDAAALAQAYNSNFGDGAAAYAGITCHTTPAGCAPAEQAKADLALWKTSLRSTLMGGQAQVQAIAPAAGNPTRQLRVVVAWRLNEGTNADGTAANTTLAETLVIRTGNTDLCPQNHICHVQYLELPNY